MANVSDRPVVALAMGDPAGIGLELTVRLLADGPLREAVSLLVVGDRRALAQGAEQCGITVDLPDVDAADTCLPGDGAALYDLRHLEPEAVTVGKASAAGGRFALANFRTALRLAADGIAQAVTFTPFNKHAMRLAEADYVDETVFINATLGLASGGSEFNILDEVWNARVTSHLPLGEVVAHITRKSVLDAIVLTDRCLRDAGRQRPRLAVAALNPHAGDGGKFGTEDDEILAPAVRDAQERQIHVAGPVPSDTVFVRALKGEFDAVVTMYHDQGQIAMKLIGFDRGVTMLGGYPFPITTPAHGTAYDIAGRGVANPTAARNAVLLAAEMARRSSRDPFPPFAETVARVAAARAGGDCVARPAQQ